MQPLAFVVSFNLSSPISIALVFFQRNVLKRPRELEHRLRFEIEAMTLHLESFSMVCVSIFLSHPVHGVCVSVCECVSMVHGVCV